MSALRCWTGLPQKPMYLTHNTAHPSNSSTMLARPGPEREKTPAKWKAGTQLILSNLPNVLAQHSPVWTISTQASPLYLISQTPTRKTANNFLYFKPSEFDARNLLHKWQKRLASLGTGWHPEVSTSRKPLPSPGHKDEGSRRLTGGQGPRSP